MGVLVLAAGCVEAGLVCVAAGLVWEGAVVAVAGGRAEVTGVWLAGGDAGGTGVAGAWVGVDKAQATLNMPTKNKMDNDRTENRRCNILFSFRIWNYSRTPKTRPLRIDRAAAWDVGDPRFVKKRIKGL